MILCYIAHSSFQNLRWLRSLVGYLLFGPERKEQPGAEKSVESEAERWSRGSGGDMRHDLNL